jgi:hypothetical protein
MSRENFILVDNLIDALKVAVEALADRELAENGPDFKSGQRSALEQNLAEHRKGNQIVIRRD